jgi:cyclopropane-fatty-acyl-phospholipid synthase
MKASFSNPSVIPQPDTRIGLHIFEKLFHAQLSKLTVGVLEFSGHGWSTSYGNGQGHQASIQVKDKAFYRKACLGGSLGIADSYADGDWDSPDLPSLFRLFLQNQDSMDNLDKGLAKAMNKMAKWMYDISLKNTVEGSRKNISLHYDLGNEFYELFLDPTMTYSCGIFEGENSTMQEASLAKYDSILEQLQVDGRHNLLEIGCGWGGFAIHAAQKTGCRVTGTTISKQQFEYAKKRVVQLGLEGSVDIVMTDYRQLESQYDRVVSIEMIEAVGQDFLPTYFGRISDRLKPDGAALVQGITMPDHRYKGYLKRVDYIRSRVFPGSCCPSVSAMVAASTQNTDLRPSSITEIGRHYVRTLQEWRQKFTANLWKIKDLGYSESFLRSWEYYLCYCEAGFAENYTNNVHYMLTKPRYQSALEKAA